jgi:hypothetical protein
MPVVELSRSGAAVVMEMCFLVVAETMGRRVLLV